MQGRKTRWLGRKWCYSARRWRHVSRTADFRGRQVIDDLGVIGAGAWGTALAITAQRAGLVPRLWSFEVEVAQSINDEHCNPVYLPEIDFEPSIRATSNIHDMAACEVLLLVTPAQHLRSVLLPLATRVSGTVPLVICSKGIEQGTLKLMSETVSELFPNNPLLVLSGPTFAREVALGLPTAVTLAGTDMGIASGLATMLGSSRFRPYVSDDIIGAQIGGALKNVMAIACGIAEGRGLGDNARSALIARGLAELTRLALAKGGKAETMAGLSGLGDLVLTCTSTQARNYSLGLALGQGMTLEDVLGNRRSVAEGVHTAAAAVGLATQLEIEMPIARGIDAILNRGARVGDVIDSLLSRPVRREGEGHVDSD